jgi:hypothetical protein
MPTDVTSINQHLPTYLDYYNTKRYHLGIQLKTPTEAIRERLQAIVWKTSGYFLITSMKLAFNSALTYGFSHLYRYFVPQTRWYCNL